MHRRHFLQRSVAAAALIPIVPTWATSHFSATENAAEFMLRLIEANDRAIPAILARQVDQPGTRLHGGIPNGYGIPTAMGTAMSIQRMASAYIAESSVFYHSAEVLAALELTAAFLLRTQHSDGTIDLLATNFHSTPDTAFVVEPLCLAYTILQGKETPALLTALKNFLLSAGKALVVGGIHTPNHRWVVSMALSRLNALFPNPAYVKRIDRWLLEQIDIDPDGQYTERSTNTYTPLTNRCLITVARLLDRPELMEPVRKNLDMTLYYVHPNGELATEASGRQDKYQVGTLQHYYYPYRYMALQDSQPLFATMTAYIADKEGPEKLIRNLAYFQEDAYLLKTLPSPDSLPDSYEKAFPHSELVRIRRGNWDATLLATNPTLFTFQRGEAVLQGLRLASSFFGAGQVSGARIEQKEGAYIMEWELSKPYYQPYPEADIPGDGNWRKMPKANRKLSEVQQMKARIEIREVESGFDIRIRLNGTDYVPVSMEIGFRKGGKLQGVSTVPGIADAYLLESETGVYTYGEDRIEFGPGQAPHSGTQLRGALPKLDAMSVYVTGYTPFEWELRIR